MDFEKLMQTAKAYATQAGYPADGDDFAQYVAMEAFRCGTKIKLKWAFASYMRASYGDTRAKKRQAVTISLDEPLIENGEMTLHDRLAAAEVETNEIKMVARNSREAFVIEQLFLGYKKMEIADQMLVSPSMISLHIKEARERYENLHMGLRFAAPHTRHWVTQCYKGDKWRRKPYRQKARRPKLSSLMIISELVRRSPTYTK